MKERAIKGNAISFNTDASYKIRSLMLSAFLETDPATKKRLVDDMASFGTISLLYLEDLRKAAQRIEDGKIFDYCKAKIKEIERK